jgi:hypothetical protein
MMFTRPIGQAEVGRIAALDDPVFRNLWITTAYHDLAQGMARLLGGLDISWSTFATWASKTAGLSIRKDVLGQLVNATLSRSAVADRVATRISLDGHPGLSHLDIAAGVSGAIDDAIAAVSRHIAEGNLKVYLFRSRQQDASLLGTAPFSDAQWTVMQAGHVPPGQL